MSQPIVRSKLPSGTILSVCAFLLIVGLILGVASVPISISNTNPTDPSQQNLFPGFTVGPAPQPERGVIVTSLETRGAAEQIGIAVGDEVEALDARPVVSPAAVADYLSHDPNPTVRITLLHNQGLREVTLNRDGNESHGS